MLTGLVVAGVMASANIANAGQVVVEIISLPHWPVQAALKPIYEMLKQFDGKIKVMQLNADEDDGKKRMKSVGEHGHIPAMILIDGMFVYTRPDGSTVEFINFPAKANSPMGISGAWTAKDVETAIKGRIGG